MQEAEILKNTKEGNQLCKKTVDDNVDMYYNNQG